MRHMTCLAIVLACGGVQALAQTPATPPAADAPRTWVDAQTGHRIVRLSDEGGSETLYFHDNSFSAEGDKFMFKAPGGIAVVDVAKIGTDGAKVEIVAPGAGAGFFARRTREIYYTAGGGAGGGAGRGNRGNRGAAAQPTQAAAPATQPNGAGRGGRGGGGRGGGGGGGGAPVMAVNVDNKQTRTVANARGNPAFINVDETLFVAKTNAEDPSGKVPKPAYREPKPQLERMFPGKKLEELTPDQQYSVNKEQTQLAPRALNPSSQAFVFTDLKTGQARTLGYQYGDLNHMQWNPVDPNLLLYCYEGTWHELDRTWTINASAGDFKLMHKRTMDMEINGHEWWSWDGKTVWFDLQTPRSQDFWIAGVNIETMKETRYHITKDTWGVHFNSSRDNTLFSSDGGDPSQVAYSTDGQWINLFRVQPDGTLAHKRLASMAKHNYVTGRGGVEPNAHITPDKKWVIYTGQFDGDRGVRHVYAVEIAKTK